MEREADHLLYMWYDVHITQPAIHQIRQKNNK